MPRVASKAFATAQSSAMQDLVKWSLKDENRAIQDALTQVKGGCGRGEGERFLSSFSNKEIIAATSKIDAFKVRILCRITANKSSN